MDRDKYRMPAIAPGPCIWRLSPSDPEWVPAVVTEVGDETVSLTIFAPDNRGNLVKSGVRHAGDPFFVEHPAWDGGCWDYCDLERRVQELERLVKGSAPSAGGRAVRAQAGDAAAALAR